MRRVTVRRPPLAAVVAALVLVVMGVAAFVGPPGSVVSEHPEAQEPVVRSSLVCPFVDGEDAGTAQVGVFAVPGVEVTDLAAGAEQQPITVEALAVSPPDGATAQPSPSASPKPVLTLTERGKPLVSEVKTAQGMSFAVAGQGTLAPGLAAEQTLVMQETDLRGISTAACTSPSREQWFVGGSGEVGRRGRLVLANPTDVPAVVDLALWDEAGPIEAPGTEDIGVPARSQRILLLDALAPGSVATAVQVSTNRGRVSTALEMRETDGITPQGMTFIPAAVAPDTDVVIPGVPRRGKQSLRIVAPGETDAIVAMQVLGPDGAYSPLDQDVLTVPGGTVLDVPLDISRDAPFGIRLESDEPVTAAVRVVDAPSDGLPDVSYTAASPSLSGPAVALLSRAGRGFHSALTISSVTDVATRVTVRVVATDGEVASEEPLDIPAGATVTAALTPPDGTVNATAIVVPDAPSTVVAARQIVATDDDGALSDLMPLVSPTSVVDVPEVVGELPSVPEEPEAG